MTTEPLLPPIGIAGHYGRAPDDVRHPTVLYRVRWTRPRWERHNGGTRWSGRYFATWRAAHRLADELLRDEAVVEVSTYALECHDTLRYDGPRYSAPPPPPTSGVTS